MQNQPRHCHLAIFFLKHPTWGFDSWLNTAASFLKQQQTKCCIALIANTQASCFSNTNDKLASNGRSRQQKFFIGRDIIKCTQIYLSGNRFIILYSVDILRNEGAQ